MDLLTLPPSSPRRRGSIAPWLIAGAMDSRLRGNDGVKGGGVMWHYRYLKSCLAFCYCRVTA